jgi:hypothetical protein
MQPCETIDSDTIPKTKKRPAWLEATLQEIEILKALSVTFKKRKKPKRFPSYVVCMTKILDEEPTTFEEEVLSLQETLLGCISEMLGNLTNLAMF